MRSIKFIFKKIYSSALVDSLVFNFRYPLIAWHILAARNSSFCYLYIY